MRLTELNPIWVGAGGEGVTNADGNPAPERNGVGVSFDCPCGCATSCFIPFKNPLDGGPPIYPTAWERTGDTFETLTLTPSILRRSGCEKNWHGFITNGEIKTV